MWRRTYLFLVLVRLYLALSSSYLHPDENFQGPEVIAGMPTFTVTFSDATRADCALVALRRGPRSSLSQRVKATGPSLGCKLDYTNLRVTKHDALTSISGQVRSSTTRCDTLGSSRPRTLSEAFSHYGPPTACRCSSCDGSG